MPIGLTAEQGQLLVDAGAAHPELKLVEAFMFRHHPKWLRPCLLNPQLRQLHLDLHLLDPP